MPRPAIKDGLSKQARYRAAKKAAGLKEVRLWVTIPPTPSSGRASSVTWRQFAKASRNVSTSHSSKL